MDRREPVFTAGPCEAYLPLVAQGSVLGGLAFAFPLERDLDEDERTILTVFAHHAAQALARASKEHLLERVLERLPVGVIVSRPPDSTLVLSNQAVGRIWRADSFPTLGADRCKFLKAMYPDGRPMPMSDSPVQRALRGETVDNVDAKIERRDGTIGWIRASAAPVLRADGSVDVAVATFVDTTAEQDARAAADEADRAKDEFLAMLGHELRNPLMPIVTALNIMELQGGEVFRSERTIISGQVRHVVRLVDDLLDISRITRGQILLEKVRVEIAQPIARAIEATTPLFEQRNQHLYVTIGGVGMPVVADPERICQAVTNLLTNASKFTQPGGNITISAERVQQDVCIRVRDTGIGIEPELLPKVFEPFVQGQRSIDRSSGGLGIGLAIVRNLVELHGGSVAARSPGVGRGTEVEIRLPLATGSAPVVAPNASAAPDVYPWRVLAVDDNRLIADGLAVLLRALGCVTQVAYDGPSAVAAAASFHPDLALVDIGLPLLDGYEVARQLRASSATAATRLVAVTGYGQPGDKQKSVEAGFDEHLVKPVELATMREVLNRLRRT
jgi:signal transduction histidine kinase